MADVPYELDGIINDLAGLEDGLQLGSFILVDQVFIQVEAGCGKERAGIIVEVGCQSLALFFLKFDRGIE